MRLAGIALLSLGILTPVGVALAQKITLQFVPQEKTGAPAPALPDYLRNQRVLLKFVDARQGPRNRVGSLSDDDDRVIPLTASNDVAAFASHVLEHTARGWGIKTGDPACITLEVGLTRFDVRESDWPFGSTYKANAGVSYTLRDAFGSTVASGTVFGDASRFGKSQSTENCNEVLSDALKEAYARLFDRRSLALRGASAPAASADGRTRIAPDALLAELRKLKSQGSSAALMTTFVEQHRVSPALSAGDVAAWRAAGIPEPVVLAAMRVAR